MITLPIVGMGLGMSRCSQCARQVSLLLPNCDAKVLHKNTETKEETRPLFSSFFQREYQADKDKNRNRYGY